MIQQKLINVGYDGYANMLSNYLLKSNEYEARMIGVVGDDLVGKSSVINALLNENILPTSVIPSEADITLKYSDTTDAICGKLENLEDLLDEKNSIEIFSNNDFLHSASLAVKEYHGIVNKKILLDTPSLSPIYECDKVIFVMSAEHLLSETECLFISNYIKYCGEDHLLLVINKIDLLNDVDIDNTLKYARNQIANKFGKVKWMVLDKRGTISNCNECEIDLRKSVLELLESGYSQTVNAEQNILRYINACLKEELLLLEKYKESDLDEINQANKKILEKKTLAKTFAENALLDFKQRKNIAQEAVDDFVKQQFERIASCLISEFDKASNKSSWYETEMKTCWDKETTSMSVLLTQLIDEIITKDINYLNEALKTQIERVSKSFEISCEKMQDDRKVIPYGRYKKYTLIGTGGLVIAGYCLFNIVGALTGLCGGSLAYAFISLKDAAQSEELKKLMKSNISDISQTTRKITRDNLEMLYLDLISNFEQEAATIIDAQYQLIETDNSVHENKIETIEDIVVHIEEMI